MNAYFEGPIRGPDGLFHLAWVWRDTPDCDTCHDVCYARSRDLVHWERSDGTPLDLPITADTCEVVDPVPPGQGLINGLVRIGFDARHRPVLSYHAYDEAGRSQIRAARLEDGRWRIRQTSHWDHRWEFGGGGTIDFEVRIGPVEASPNGTLVQDHTSVAGSGTWTLDPATLAVSGTTTPRRPAGGGVESPFPGMEVRRAFDTGRDAPLGIATAGLAERPWAWEQHLAWVDATLASGAGSAELLAHLRPPLGTYLWWTGPSPAAMHGARWAWARGAATDAATNAAIKRCCICGSKRGWIIKENKTSKTGPGISTI
jgi:hypothetical protein